MVSVLVLPNAFEGVGLRFINARHKNWAPNTTKMWVFHTLTFVVYFAHNISIDR